jgi:probable O-glycosylation ligase (exosortase A-associated)
MRDILLVLMTLGLSIVALKRPFVGMLGFVFYGFFVPQSWTWSFAYDFPHSQLLAGATIIGLFITGESKRLPSQRESVLVIVLWVFFLITTLAAETPPAAWVQFNITSKIFLMVLLSLVMMNSPERIHNLLRVMAFALGLYAVKGAIFFIRSGGNGMVSGPEGSYLAANNTLGVALVVNLPILLYLLRQESLPWLKRICQLMMAATFVAVIGTMSRGAWLALAVVTLLLMVRAKRKGPLIAKLILLTAIAMPVATAVLPTLIASRVGVRAETFENLDDDQSAQSRFWNWEYCKRVGLANPLLGGGFNHVSRAAYAKYYPEMLKRWPGRTWSCHSIWFGVFSEHGFPGFFMWVGLLVSTFLSMRWIRRVSAGSAEFAWANDLASMVEISLLGFVISGSFVDVAYYDGYYQLVMVIVATKALLMKASESKLANQPIDPVRRPQKITVHPVAGTMGLSSRNSPT